jgi:hypothetical protein
MLWKATTLMRFAPFPTINSVSSNAAVLRVQFPMENRLQMTRRDGASYLPNLNEGCEKP